MDLKTGVGRIVHGSIDGLKPGCSLILEDEDMFSMVTGKLDPQKVIYFQIFKEEKVKHNSLTSKSH